MRVLHVNSYYSVGPFYRGLFEAQRQMGEQLSVFVPVAQGFQSPFDFGDYTTVSPDHGRFDRLWFPLKHGKILKDAENRFGGQRFDVAHAHSLFSNGYIAWQLHQRHGWPYAVAVRDSDVNAFFRRMPHLRGMGRAILRDAARVIFLSAPYRDSALAPYLSQDALDAVKAKSEVIPNGIDAFWHAHRADAPHRPDPGVIRLLLVGRASKRKNALAALAAADALAAQGKKVRFDVVIGLVEDPGILDRIRAHPLVTLHQNLSREQLLPLYRAADVFVLPSLQETFGLAYAEAMSQGLPVIYTAGQGFDGQFPDGHVGYAVNPRDPQEIAARILDILSRHESVARAALLESARYDWTAFAARYAEIYREVAHADS